MILAAVGAIVLALTGADAERKWTSATIGKRKAKDPAATLVLTVRDPDHGWQVASEGLELAVRMFRMGMREPLPLFPELSYKICKGKARRSDWQGFEYNGEGYDEHNAVAFAGFTYDDVMAIPTVPGDPGRTGRRVEVLSRSIWKMVLSTSDNSGTSR